jgi:hypothetical protein
MIRKALIIGNPGETGAQNYCEGVKQDLTNYPAFLKQPLGGAWESGEITVLLRPNVSDVKNALVGIKAANYAVVIFAGHGYYSTSHKSTLLELKRGEEIDSRDLCAGAGKQTVILDCCRKVAQAQIQKSFAEAIVKRASILNRADCRKYYDDAISKCSSGLAVLWGCKVGEAANDDPQNGGYYSAGLLEAATEWAKNNNTDTSRHIDLYSIVGAHEAAVPLVSRQSGGRQNPVIEKPRSDPYFPFAIIA